MEERRLGRYYHAPTETDWQVVAWGTPAKQKEVGENRLTRNDLQRSNYTTFAIKYPDGTVIHRSFSGVLPLDLETLVDYWQDHESL